MTESKENDALGFPPEVKALLEEPRDELWMHPDTWEELQLRFPSQEETVPLGGIGVFCHPVFPRFNEEGKPWIVKADPSLRGTGGKQGILSSLPIRRLERT